MKSDSSAVPINDDLLRLRRFNNDPVGIDNPDRDYLSQFFFSLTALWVLGQLEKYSISR